MIVYRSLSFQKDDVNYVLKRRPVINTWNIEDVAKI